ncbi:hypothetical protein F2P81_009143 [Scophthalmus maximus]|uniref:Uncharacterized protein n=1 Tax=Scophthalmus maximus TaxID=52904 RepID=A0A6A4T0X7_SCOMX|nr:hypothetical protein F2P81_009143 [Scophthalmus maximus]
MHLDTDHSVGAHFNGMFTGSIPRACGGGLPRPAAKKTMAPGGVRLAGSGRMTIKVLSLRFLSKALHFCSKPFRRLVWHLRIKQIPKAVSELLASGSRFEF